MKFEIGKKWINECEKENDLEKIEVCIIEGWLNKRKLNDEVFNR